MSALGGGDSVAQAWEVRGSLERGDPHTSQCAWTIRGKAGPGGSEVGQAQLTKGLWALLGVTFPW